MNVTSGHIRRPIAHTSWQDAVATMLVGGAVAVYGLWFSRAALTGLSVRSVGAIVLVLGLAACTTARREMEMLFGPAERRTASALYLAAAVTGGVAATAAGIVTVAAASETALAVLVAVTIGLWTIATVRHALDADARAHRFG